MGKEFTTYEKSIIEKASRDADNNVHDATKPDHNFGDYIPEVIESAFANTVNTLSLGLIDPRRDDYFDFSLKDQELELYNDVHRVVSEDKDEDIRSYLKK